MDDLRIGRAVRALRQRRGWTQVELARVARVSPATVSRVERGRVAAATVRVVRAIFTSLEARIDIVVRWNGAELDRLIDAQHAALAEVIIRRLSQLPDWITEPEVTFSIFGERGSIDLVAWHPGRRVLLIVEVKSAIGEVGALVRQVDRYRRLAREIARQRGWLVKSVGVWVVVADGRTARRRLADHRTTLRRAFPADGHAVEAWLRAPIGDLNALSFVPLDHDVTARRGRRSAA
jgi:transcriptional regulator with XRE-family HTH domain